MLRFKRRPNRAVIGLFFVSASVFAQSPTIPDQVKTAFTSNVKVGTVTLDGTYVSVEGSLRQQGTAHFAVNGDGTYSFSLSKNSGAAGEQRKQTDSDMTCTWTDGRGNDHPMDSSNCQTPAWFLPELPVLLPAKAVPEWSISDQSRDASGIHLTFSSAPVADKKNFRPPAIVAMTMDVSANTFLPSQASFFIHPDHRPNVNIPVKVTYEDYRQVSGVNIPFHVQKFVNGTLVLDVSISTANVN